METKVVKSETIDCNRKKMDRIEQLIKDITETTFSDFGTKIYNRTEIEVNFGCGDKERDEREGMNTIKLSDVDSVYVVLNTNRLVIERCEKVVLDLAIDDSTIIFIEKELTYKTD